MLTTGRGANIGGFAADVGTAAVPTASMVPKRAIADARMIFSFGSSCGCGASAGEQGTVLLSRFHATPTKARPRKAFVARASYHQQQALSWAITVLGRE